MLFIPHASVATESPSFSVSPLSSSSLSDDTVKFVSGSVGGLPDPVLRNSRVPKCLSDDTTHFLSSSGAVDPESENILDGVVHN